MKIDDMNNDIESHSEMKLLGVTIDKHLNFSTHIGEVCKNVSRKVGVLMMLRNMLTTLAKLKIFISFIMPQITYCPTVWHFCRALDSSKMERVQEQVLRAVYCNKKSSYDELLRKAKLMTLGCHRLQDIAIIIYKAKYNIHACPQYIKDIFKLNKPCCRLRNSGDFFIPRYNTTTYGRHRLRYVGPVIWSKLSKDVKNAESIYSFKKKICKVDLGKVITKGCKNCFLCCT